MPHEHLVYDACETCLGQGVVVRIWREGKSTKLKHEPCPACEGLGFRRDTERTETVSDEDADDQ